MTIGLWLLPGMVFLSAAIGYFYQDAPHLANRLAISTITLALIITILVALNISNDYIESIHILNFDRITLSLSFIFDRLTMIMMLLVGTISLLIHHYAARYLLSDVTQVRFMMQLSLLTASIMVLVMSGNLLTAFFGWQLIGLCLYFLLNHYHYDIKANKAAKKKFIVNRFGDTCFLIAILIAYQYYGSTDFHVLFKQAANLEYSLGFFTHQSAILLLIFVAVMTKSAQFPFHFWLPDTMEAPTPVSAIMHAGAINAGGFLLARLSPLLMQTPAVMTIIFIVGFISALMGGFFILTQSDIKKQLAYSTIGQMGYMIMQCGLGCFAAAIFHLIAHGIFKATLFLNSGGALITTSHQGNKYDTKKYLVIKLFSTIVCTSVIISTGVLWLNFIHSENGLNVILWVFISITLAQITWFILNDKYGIRNNIFLLLALNIVFIAYLSLLSSFHFILGVSEKNLMPSFWQLSMVGVLGVFSAIFWFIPVHLLFNISIMKRLYLFGLNNGYIETIIRQVFLNPLRRLGDILNLILLPVKNNFTRALSNIFLLVLVAAMLCSMYSLRQHTLIDNTIFVIISMVVLVIFLIAANRARSLRQIMLCLFVTTVALSNIAYFIGTVQGKIIALFYMINISILFAALWLLLNQYSQQPLYVSTRFNRLPPRDLYLSIILMLFIGVPGTASFIGEFFILHGLMSISIYWLIMIAFPMILLAVVVLHTLQIYVFSSVNISRANLSLSPGTHFLCWISIGFNIFNGVYPSWLLHILSQLYGAIV